MPGLSSLKKSLDDIQTQVKKLLGEKRVEEPDETDESGDTEQIDGQVISTGAAGVAVTSVGGTIQNRKDALKRLSDLAEFFRRTEPHSPISYLVQRAVKWGDMPLESWLQDVIKDESVISELRQMLGFNTSLSDSSEAAES